MIERESLSQTTRKENELQNLSNQDIDHIKITLENMGKKYYSILDIGRSLGFKIYEDAKIVQNSELIRGIALNLGITTASQRKPNFSLEEAKNIVIELTSRNFEEISQKESVVIENTASRMNNENHSFLFKEKKIILSGINGSEMNMLRIFAETSRENPISGPSLAEKMYGNEVEPKIARNRVYAILHNLRAKLKKYNLAIVAKEIRVGKDKGNKIVTYHIVDKSDSVKTDDLERKLVESESYIEEDIFVTTTEAEKWDFKNQAIAASTVNKLSDKKKELDFVSSPLEDDEIYVIIQGLCNMQENNKEMLIESAVDMGYLETEDVRRLLNRMRVKLDKNRMERIDFMEKSNSAYRKLSSFIKNQDEYFKSCKPSAQFLLKCFDPAKINKDFLKELLFVQSTPISKSRGETEV